MKSAGRLGSSAIPGAGCYAINGDAFDGTAEGRNLRDASAAAAVSGCGEDIMEQFVAMECCRAMRQAGDVKGDAMVPLKQLDGVTSVSDSPTPMRQIMQRLIVKKQTSSSPKASVRKRRRNDSGSQDTFIEDGGLSTGIIALRADEKVQGELEVHFSWAHTARHFALAFAAGDDVGVSYEGKAWVNTQAQSDNTNTTMQMGELHETFRRTTQHSSLTAHE